MRADGQSYPSPSHLQIQRERDIRQNGQIQRETLRRTDRHRRDIKKNGQTQKKDIKQNKQIQTERYLSSRMNRHRDRFSAEWTHTGRDSSSCINTGAIQVDRHRKTDTRIQTQ